MAINNTNEFDYNPADLIGNVSVPRLTLPTVRSAKRRNDADGVSTVPYYPGINAKKLNIGYTDNTLTPQQVTVTASGTGYQALIDNIKAVDPTNLEAIDMGGFLAIRNTNSGDNHYVQIVPQFVTSDEAAALLGFQTYPMPGYISYAGELASTPGHREQLNPQGAALISKGDDLVATAFNRAFVSILREIEKLRSDAERFVVQYVTLPVVVQNHEVTTGTQGFYLDLDTHNLFMGGQVSWTSTHGQFDHLMTLTQSTGNKEVFTTSYEKVQLKAIHYATAATALTTGSSFTTWGTPDGKNVIFGDVPSKIKHASVAISAINGSVLYCPGAQFQTKKIRKNDPLKISGATNLSPYNHNGWFAVHEVLDNEHVRVRTITVDELPGFSGNVPFALNPSGTGFGNVEISFGNFIPLSKMFFALSCPGGGVSNGIYSARIAIGRSLRQSNLWSQSGFFPQKADPSAGLQTHANDTSDAHEASSIGGFTSATTWWDGSTITGGNLQTTIENILTDLASTVSNGGSNRIGSPALATTGFTAPWDLAPGTVNSQLLELLGVIQAHETQPNFHPEYGITAGFSLGTYSFPNLPINGGTLVATYLGEKREFNPVGTSFSLIGNQLYIIYLDLADNTIKITQTGTVGFAATAVPLWYLFTQGFGITWTSDFRVPLASAYARQKGFVTVGPSGTNSDFPNISDAIDWILWYRGTYGAGPTTIAKSWEIVVQGNVTMNRVSGAFYFPMTIRGASLDAQGTPVCAITIPPGTFSHQVGGAFSAATIPDGINGVVIKDLRFITPTTTTTVNNPTIKITSNTYEITHWLIENCVFSGGTNAPFIWIQNSANYVVVPKHITIKDCWFKGANNRTTENPHILIEKSQDCVIENCRFEGSTADALTDGIRFEGVNDAGFAYGHMVRGCTFDMGGRHIIVTNDVDDTTIRNCIFRNSRASAINSTSTGEVYVSDCYFNTCMTNSNNSNGVILSSGSGTVFTKGCRFKNWATGYAVLLTGGQGHHVDNCIMTASAVNQAIIGTDYCSFSGNDIDLKPGATSGSGHDIGIVLSIGTHNKVIGNTFKNCGSTATSSGDIVISFDSFTIIGGNSFFNCRGILLDSSGDHSSIWGTVTDDVGAAATDKGVSIQDTNCVVVGNIFSHTSSGKPIETTAVSQNAHVVGNALAVAVASTATQGIIGAATFKNIAASIGSQTVGAGLTIVVTTIPMPTTGFGCHIPTIIGFQGKVGNLEPGFRFTYQDGSSEDCNCTGVGGGDQPFDAVSPATNFNNRIPSLNTYNNISIVRVDIIVRNVGGAPETQTLGQWRYRGWVIG